jgi:hypothetical protein
MINATLQECEEEQPSPEAAAALVLVPPLEVDVPALEVDEPAFVLPPPAAELPQAATDVATRMSAAVPAHRVGRRTNLLIRSLPPS